LAYYGWSTSSMSAIPGQSGSSLILNLNGKQGIIGVQDVGNSSEGYAEVMTQPILNELAKFERSHPAIAGPMAQVATQPTSDGVAVSSKLTVNTPGSSGLVATGNAMTTGTSGVDPLSSPPTSLSPAVASSASAPNTAAPSLSALQLFLDGIILAKDLSSPGGLSTALSDAALMQDIDAAGGLLNPYLDAGLLTAMSVLDGSHNS
jgi:hypothetical protein